MLKQKILNKENGILLYGLTPPRHTHSKEQMNTIAQKHIQRINTIDIDALVLYDIQDESDRTAEKRTFPFVGTLDPYVYKNQYLSELNIPTIVYRAVGKYNKNDFSSWLKDTKNQNNYSVFVGAASKEQDIKLSVKEAYALKEEINKDLVLGAITIPERHTIKKDEHIRVFNKIDQGCKYFITQCVYNLEAAKIFLSDYARYAKEHNKEMVPIIITLTPCGSSKTLEFMEWLGINIPNYLKEDLLDSKDILQESLDICLNIFTELNKFALKRGIPLGCNVESVAIRKEEIDASIVLLKEVDVIMRQNITK